MRLTEHVYVVGGGRLGYGISNDYDCNVYALDCGTEIVLLDAGAGIEPERIVRQLEQDGLARTRVRKLLLTHAHADHAGGAAAWHALLGVDVYAPDITASMVESGDEARMGLIDARRDGVYPASYRFQPCAVNRRLADEEAVRIGEWTLQVVAAPGHSADMVCYYCPELRALFAGDAIFAEGKLAVIGTPDCSLADYRGTIEKLARLDVKQLFPGHLEAVLDDAHEAIAAAQQRFQRGQPPVSIV